MASPLDTSLGYLEGHFDSFIADLNGPCAPGEDPYFCGTNNYKDIPLPDVPHWNISGGLNYHHELPFGVFNANFNGAYTSSQYTSLTPINVVAPDFTLRPANTILNTTLSLTTLDGKYRISAWVKNLTDQHVLYERFTVGSALRAGKLRAAAYLGDFAGRQVLGDGLYQPALIATHTRLSSSLPKRGGTDGEAVRAGHYGAAPPWSLRDRSLPTAGDGGRAGDDTVARVVRRLSSWRTRPASRPPRARSKACRWWKWAS